MSCPDDNLLVAMADQALDAARFAEVELHIDTCEHCRKIVAAAVVSRSLAVGTPTVGGDTGPLAAIIDVSINGRYVIAAVLGKGGMGTVYLARDLSLDREVALKLHRAGSADDRLQREAMAMAKLAHPNVVTVFEVASVDDRMYVAMEYVKGETLRGWLTASPRTWQDIVGKLIEVGAGLAAAHAAGLVHRDFKPENVLVGEDGRPRVSDFGLARVGATQSGTSRAVPPSRVSGTDVTQAAETTGKAHVITADTPLTVSGTVVGTPAYMAPEQLTGDVVDARCDQFAFCVVAWELLYGKRPFSGIDRLSRLRPGKAPVPARVREVIERGLAHEADDRYPDMPSLLAALRRAAQPRTKRRLAIALAGTVLAGGAALAGASVVGERRHEAACEAEADGVRHVFDVNARETMRAQFFATHSPMAASSFDRASVVLDRYISVLATKTSAACRGLDEPPKMTTARRACLDEKQHELAALTDVLSHPDSAIVQRAANAAWAIFDPAPCDDAQTLLARSSNSSTTPEHRAQLSKLKAMTDAGRYEPALAATGPLLAEARAANDKNLELAVLLLTGNLRSELEKPDASAALHSAIAIAESLGRDLDAANAFGGLANLSGVVQHDFQAAHRYIALARAKLERLGGANLAVRGELLMTEAQVFLDDNRLGEAETAMRQAAAVLEQAYGSDHPKLGAALGTLSQVLRAQGKHDESFVASTRTLTILEHALGPDHPTVAGAEMNLSQDLMDKEQYAQARDKLLHADSVFVRSFGEVHPVRAAIAGNLAALEKHLKNWDASLAASRRAVTILETIEGPDSADVSGARRDVALALARADRIAEAIAEEQRAIAILLKLGPDGEGRLVSAWTELAEMQLVSDRPAAARPTAERAVALALTRPADANPAELADARDVLARAKVAH